MQLTKWTDYSLRVLMYCALHEGRAAPVSVAEIHQAHGISRSHLTKVVMALAAAGYLETTRGRGGGLRLQRPADQIFVGEVMRRTESDFILLECFDPEVNACRIAGHCRLQGVLEVALSRFFEVVDGVSLADLFRPGVTRCAVAREATCQEKGLPLAAAGLALKAGS